MTETLSSLLDQHKAWDVLQEEGLGNLGLSTQSLREHAVNQVTQLLVRNFIHF